MEKQQPLTNMHVRGTMEIKRTKEKEAMNQQTKKTGIVSFDLDMTLLDHGTWKVPDSAMEALRQLRKNWVVVVASGRNMNAPYSVPYRDMVKPDAIIHMNGTMVEAEGKMLYEKKMDRELLKRLLEFGESHGLAVGLTTGEADYYTHPEEVVRTDRERWGMSDRHFQDPKKLLDMPIRSLAYAGGPEGAAALEKAFPELKFPLFAGKMGADIVDKDSSKANGLKILCGYYGIDMSRTVAFGDSMNDLEIIRAAGTGVAMGNALDELKAAADYVTTAIQDDGIWNACVALGLLR